MNRKVHVACNFQLSYGNWRLIKVTGNHINCKSGDISEPVQDKERSLIGRDIGLWPIEYQQFLWPPVIFKVIQLYSKPFEMEFFVHLFSSWQDFRRHTASQALSVIAELLVQCTWLPVTLRSHSLSLRHLQLQATFAFRSMCKHIVVNTWYTSISWGWELERFQTAKLTFEIIRLVPFIRPQN